MREAIARARRALLLDPSNYDALVLLGTIYSDFDDEKSLAEALQAYDPAIGLEPGRFDAYLEKADLFMDQKRHSEALPLAKKGFELALRDESDPYLLALEYMTWIRALFENKRFKEARRAIQDALQACPGKLMSSSADDWLRLIADAEKAKLVGH
ncbi:MAG TPA: tetratricopeptide repeat protein [Candidatus Binataceae bacterium]|nr:tetratricopeptide repeat protein [Candidatus Binataceae bacterium]